MFFSPQEVAKLKLDGIRSEELKELAVASQIDARGTAGALKERLLTIPQAELDSFIKRKYQEKIRARQALMPDARLREELGRVENVSWGVVQGQLDQKIQAEYVRRFMRYDELKTHVEETLHDEITSYVTASWYNHWTTVLIEDHISSHPNIVPTLKNNFGVDIFFREQPFDLKITYLPKGFPAAEAMQDPQKLAQWMYENQGALRFGDDNRLFVVLLDRARPEESWKLKRDFDFVFTELDRFFDTATLSDADRVSFSFQHKPYETHAKVLLITK